MQLVCLGSGNKELEVRGGEQGWEGFREVCW